MFTSTLDVSRVSLSAISSDTVKGSVRPGKVLLDQIIVLLSNNGFCFRRKSRYKYVYITWSNPVRPKGLYGRFVHISSRIYIPIYFQKCYLSLDFKKTTDVSVFSVIVDWLMWFFCCTDLIGHTVIAIYLTFTFVSRCCFLWYFS